MAVRDGHVGPSALGIGIIVRNAEKRKSRAIIVDMGIHDGYIHANKTERTKPRRRKIPMILTTKAIDVRLSWDDGRHAAYRIEVDVSNPHKHLQRHIWTMVDGSGIVENWIIGAQLSARDLESGRFAHIT